MKRWITNSVAVMLLTVISQVLGYVREILFAYYLGTSGPLEAFQMAETVPMLFTQILIGAVPLALTPLLVKEYENGERNELINNAILLFTAIMFVIMVLIMWKTEWFVSIVAPGFTGDKFYLTCRLTTILAPNVLLLSLASLFNAYLSAKEEFIVPTTIYLILNIFIVVAQILTKANVYYVAIASLSASITVFIMLLCFIYKRYTFKLEISLLNIEKMLVIGKTVLPVCIISMFSSLNLMLDKFFASMCGNGSVVVFTYSYKIINLPVFLFTMSITKVMLPNITKLINSNSLDELAGILRKIFLICIVGGLAGGIIIAVLSYPIIGLLFGHGEFNDQAIARTSECLQIFGFGIAGMALSTFCQSIAYAFGNYFEPFKVLVIQICLYIVIAAGTNSIFGVKGIALANVIAYLLATVIWGIILQKKYRIRLFFNNSINKK